MFKLVNLNQTITANYIMQKTTIPGPKGRFLIGSAIEVKEDVLGYMLKNMNEFRTIAKVRIGPKRFINLYNPDYVQHVLQGNHRNYKKGREIENLVFLLGHGLLTSEGEFWLKQRRLIQPVFHKKRLAGFAEQMARCTENMLARWETLRNGEVIDIHLEMNRLALDIVSKTLFSIEVKEEFRKVNSALNILMQGLFGRARSIINIPFWMPTPKNFRLKEQKQVLDDIIEDIIRKRRKSAMQHEDLLGMLMEVEDADTAERMTDRQLRDELLTLFLAGHETTANALTFTLYNLSQHPEVEQRVKEEVETVLNGRMPTPDDLRSLRYTLQVIQESMRLYPPAWGITRQALGDDMIGEHYIRKGDDFVIAPFALHRHPDHWEAPNTFDPERFTDENMKQRHKYAYIPFGGGPRLCIGNNFALMEMQVAISMIMQRFSVKLKKDHTVELEPTVTLRPKYGMMMTIM